MPSDSQTIIAFDLYGTLLSTASIAEKLSEYYGDGQAPDIAALWRRLQLEYTWRLNSMGEYEPFSSITRNSLIHALTEWNVSLDEPTIDSLMRAYDSLSTFPDVAPALQALAKEPTITPVIFSNGTNSMVTNSVRSSPDLGPHASVFKEFVTVDDVRRFKPCPELYYHLAEKVGKPRTREAMAEIWLVSGNPFDVVGARKVGMQAVWVNREEKSLWKDELVQGEVGKPTFTVSRLGEVLEYVKTVINGG